MRELKRKLYKRASSYEITIPKALIWDLNLKKKHYVEFELISKDKWSLSIKTSKSRLKSRKILLRKLYTRGHSFETTLPLPVVLGLDSSKKYIVIFRLEKGKWIINFEETK